MTRICPFCLKEHEGIYTVVYDQCYFDVAFAHKRRIEIGDSPDVFCGVDMEGAWNIVVRPSDRTVHVLRNAKMKGSF